MQIEPNQKVGHCTRSMVVVICPQCHQKRWANIMKQVALEHRARTTCCGVVTNYRGVERKVEEKSPEMRETPTPRGKPVRESKVVFRTRR